MQKNKKAMQQDKMLIKNYKKLSPQKVFICLGAPSQHFPPPPHKINLN